MTAIGGFDCVAQQVFDLSLEFIFGWDAAIIPNENQFWHLAERCPCKNLEMWLKRGFSRSFHHDYILMSGLPIGPILQTSSSVYSLNAAVEIHSSAR